MQQKDVPTRFLELVAARRAADEQFPKIVPAVETGSLGGTLSWRSQGSADAFKDVPANKLLASLALPGSGMFGERDDAEALARTAEGKRRIIEAIEIGDASDETTAVAWKLLLSYSHVKDDDAQNDRKII